MQRSCLVLHIHVMTVADCYSLAVPGLQIRIILYHDFVRTYGNTALSSALLLLRCNYMLAQQNSTNSQDFTQLV